MSLRFGFWFWWWHFAAAVFVAVLCWGAVMLLSQGVDALRASETGISGTVTPLGCEPFAKASTCDGSFRSDDGTVVIDRVTFHPEVRQWPMEPLQLVVASPEADQAHPDGEWWVQIASGLFFAGMATWIVFTFVREL